MDVATHNGADKIPHLIHSVVVLLKRAVLWCFFVPAIQPKFPDAVNTRRGKEKFPLLQSGSSTPDGKKNMLNQSGKKYIYLILPAL